MNAYTHSALLVAVMSATVITLRALPFLIFKGKKTPKFITYLGVYLPSAIMGMLVVYCLRNVSVTEFTAAQAAQKFSGYRRLRNC